MISKSLQFRLYSTASILLVLLIAFFLIISKIFAATTVDVKFVSHIEANLPEQDVFVVAKDDPKMVVRVEGDQAKDAKTLAKDVYTAASTVPHDPFKLGPNPLGPYPKGKELGFTLEQWLGAKGSGTYTVDGDTAKLDLTFDGLVPNGVYTVWCSRLTFPPNPKVVDRPCGAEDGTENSFKAFANGGGEFKLTMKPLEESTKETASVIALAYHSDGKTYGAIPGDFGLTSHVQIVFLLPPPAQAAESPVAAATPTPAPTMLLGLSQTAWIVIVVVIVVLVLGWLWYSKKTPPSSPQTPSSPEA